MPQREFNAYLRDIIEATEAISRYVEGMTFDEYLGDTRTRDAVERRFMVIGEALSQASKLKPELQLTSLRDIVSFRNVLVHGYHGLDQPEIWRTIEEDLVPLVNEVRALLGPAPA
jgi:uncharacterized protein with HEPN domain